MEGRRKNGKQLEIIEFDGLQVGTKVKVVTAQKNQSDFGHLYKINYLDDEAFDRGMWLQMCTNLCFYHFYHNRTGNQWRIQDFTEEGAPTPEGGLTYYFTNFFPKTAWK